jgi:ABC-type Fe3+ transport system permease subunit
MYYIFKNLQVKKKMFGTASFVLLIILCILVIAYSSTVLAYTGYINQKGSDEQKRAKPNVRKGLIVSSAILLVLAVAVVIVASVQYSKDREGGRQILYSGSQFQ